MKENIILTKSYSFALKVVRVYKDLCENKKEFVLSKQLLKSGTSIGANLEETVGGQSKKDFLAKVSIAYKEARESHYWIRLLYDGGYICLQEKESLIGDCEEIIKIITKIQKTTKENMSNTAE